VLPYAEATQASKVFGSVIPMLTVSPSRQRERSESYAEPEPAQANAKRFGSFGNRVCAMLFDHAHIFEVNL
jgi:hypothetical protein